MTATGITGWWPLIQVLLDLPVSPVTLGMSAQDVGAGAFQIAPSTPALTMAESATDVAAFQLAPTVTLPMVEAGISTGAFSLPTTAALTMAGADVQAGTLSLPTTAALTMAGADVQVGTLQLPSSVALAMTGGNVEPAAFALSVTPSLAFDPGVLYDATGTGNHGLLTSSGITNAHTLGARATALLVGISNFIASDSYSSVTSNSCLLGSTAMSLLGFITNDAAGNGWTEVWGLIFPAGTYTGSQTITYKEAAGASYPVTLINSVSYSGVASFGTAVTNMGASTALSTGSVASAIENMVFAAMGGGGSAHPLSLSGSGTSRWLPSNPGGYINLLLQDIAGASTVTETATAGAAVAWGSVAIPLIAA